MYSDIIYPYPPLLTFILATLYKIFGYQLMIAKLFVIILLLINDGFIYLILRRFVKSETVFLLGVLFYVIIQSVLEGNMLWFDVVMVTPVLVSTYFLLKKNYFWAGLFMGVAALTKQTAGILAIIGIYYAIREGGIGSLKKYLACPIGLGIILFGWLLTTNQFIDFWNWVLWYPLSYWSSFPGYVQMSVLGKERIMFLSLIISLGLLLIKVKKVFLVKSENLVLLGSTLLSLVVVYPRFSFFHLQLFIAFWCILFTYLVSFINLRKLYLFTILLMGFLLIGQVKVGWQKEARFWGRDDFYKVENLKKIIGDEKEVYLLGLPSQYYVIGNFLPPKPWFDNFGWYLEILGEQEKILKSWEDNPPGYIIRQIPKSGNWYDLGVYEPEKIVGYIKENYVVKDKLGNVEIWQKD